ncbi:hypothetical protein HK098_005978 [Nowakowskiella sp. JEL0407]|nr:hypothetical protein HK098_005978 [Nowakowskiella sp. JEL0407]
MANRLNTLRQELDGVVQNLQVGIDSTCEAAYDSFDSPAFNRDHFDAILLDYLDLLQFTNIQKQLFNDLRAPFEMAYENQPQPPKINNQDPLDYFNLQFELKKKEYLEIPKELRLNRAQEYKTFKKKLWEVEFPNRPYNEGGGGTQQPMMDEDEDLMVVEEAVNYLCPITKKPMLDPYTSIVCTHSYSNAIIDMIRRSGGQEVECPVAGCNMYIRMSQLKQNKTLRKKVLRWEAMQRATQENVEAEYEDA